MLSLFFISTICPCTPYPHVFLQEHTINSDEALTLPSLPTGPIVVLGAGYIATEFAGIFAGLGGKVRFALDGTFCTAF